MADETQEDELVRMALRIPGELLPDWFDEVQRVAAAHVRRMGVVEKPDEWLVQVELDPERAEAFHTALQAAWAAFQQR